MNENKYERGINITVRDLKDILEGLPDDMEVITTVTPEDNSNYVISFKHVRTAGILSNPYEPKPVLCIAPTESGTDMYALIEGTYGDTKCEKLLF